MAILDELFDLALLVVAAVLDETWTERVSTESRPGGSLTRRTLVVLVTAAVVEDFKH